MVDTTDEWIVAAHRHPRAPHRRRRARPPPTSATRGRARGARRRRASTPADIDLIIVATSTPDNTFPATAVAGAGRRSASPTAPPSTCRRCAPASSTRSPTADSLLKTGTRKRALVIGAETFSRILDWTDRTTCVLFGDGAGAVVLEAQPAGRAADRGVLTVASALRRPPPRQALCRRRPVLDRHRRPPAHGGQGGVPPRGRHDHRRGRGRASRRPATPPTTSTGSCRTRPTSASSTAPAQKLGIAPDKGGDRPSTGTATPRPPRSRWRWRRRCADGRIKRGDLVLLEAMGGGFTWGSALIRW